eukprot:7652245-Ditylum_brightwellii.AAC.1
MRRRQSLSSTWMAGVRGEEKVDCVHEPAKEFVDGAPGAFAARQFFEGDWFVAHFIIGVVWAEDAINAAEEVTGDGVACGFVTLCKRHEVVHVHICVLEEAGAVVGGE